MKKQDLAARLAANHDVTKACAERIIDSIGDILREDLVPNSKTTYFGLGTLIVVPRARRIGRNLQTGAPIIIPAKKGVKLKASPAFKNMVNGELDFYGQS